MSASPGLSRPIFVLDTNVVVSGLLFGGQPGRLVDLWKSQVFRPVVSGEIMAEYLRTLAYPKFGLNEAEISSLLRREILPWFETVDAVVETSFIPDDPSDEKFIACALAANADAIISGDAHLLNARSPVRVLRVAEALESLRRG